MINLDELKDIPFLEGLNRPQMEHIAGKLEKRTCARGSVLFMEGEESNGTYFIASGLVKIVKLHKEGREKTLAILRAGDMLGEMTLFEDSTRSATAEAMEDTTLFLITNNDLKQMLIEIPQLALRVVQVLSMRLRQTNQHIQELTFLNARSRIICNLVHLASVHGINQQGCVKIPLRLTHSELANLVGVTRETVTKVLDELQKDSLIQIKNKQLWLMDMEKLYQQGTIN